MKDLIHTPRFSKQGRELFDTEEEEEEERLF